MTGSNPQVDITGDVAFVTGAASGIGLAVTSELNPFSARVIIVDLNDAAASKLADEFNGKAGETVAVAVKTDITSWDQQVAAYEVGKKTFGRVDYFVANAGIAEFPWLPKFDPSTARSRPITQPKMAIVDVDLSAHLMTAALALQVFERQDLNRHGFRGKLVMTSSLYGVFPSMCQPMYSAAKGGIVHFVRASAQFHAKKDLTVNVVCPGLVATNIVSPGFLKEFQELGLVTTQEQIVQPFISLLGGSKDNGRVVCVNQDKVWDQSIMNDDLVEGLLPLLERKVGQTFGYWE
ncbi:hypothetical protein VNI00_009098 [Paramarasmius palmivorus]|uniref:15-hydroxyprostaglandin dehydrogenase n=1 Tax=Paramarasmius palmivorus TaxID=297713 RepID=A0AAW0CRH5_9AGAR